MGLFGKKDKEETAAAITDFFIDGLSETEWFISIPHAG